MRADSGSCGGATVNLPFTDVQGNIFFCQIAAAYFSGLTAGTSATTYGPTQNVNREQMAAFTTRTLDQSLKRGSRRAALGQWATPRTLSSVGFTTVASVPRLLASDGADLWVASSNSHTVSRVQASSGRVLQTWTGDWPWGVCIAAGQVFVTGHLNSGRIYRINPTQTAGPFTLETVATGVGIFPDQLAFDGTYLWTAGNDNGANGSICRIALGSFTVGTFTAGFIAPTGILYDGAFIWVTDIGDNTLKKVNPANGQIVQVVDAGITPVYPVFDGTNIWVPNFAATPSVTVVRAATGQVLAQLTGNGLSGPVCAAFDGERVLVTNSNTPTGISLWKAADLSPLGTLTFADNTSMFGACSDGINFWLTLHGSDQLVRF
jgi:hypothetical protein